MARPSFLVLAIVCTGCHADAPTQSDTDSAATAATAATSVDPSLTTSSGTVGEGSSPTAVSTAATGASTSTSVGSTASSSGDSSTGATTCDKHVVLMGYWPPTNEMLRQWSTNVAQNPGGWQGENWGGYGYDVYAFFPEFPPDGDPTNDQIGDDGAVGSPDFDLRVDYQASSSDFWRIVDEHQPVILLTTSRGGEIGWEIEALEGGHGDGNAGDPALDWTSDGYGVETLPTMATIDARSWDAISTHRQDATLPTQLPVDAIFDATSVLGLTDVVIDARGTSGNFLSGFLALHGLYYQLHAPHAVAAGHIHVGLNLPVADASVLVETTLHALLEAHPIDRVTCP